MDIVEPVFLMLWYDLDSILEFWQNFLGICIFLISMQMNVHYSVFIFTLEFLRQQYNTKRFFRESTN